MTLQITTLLQFKIYKNLSIFYKVYNKKEYIYRFKILYKITNYIYILDNFIW